MSGKKLNKKITIFDDKKYTDRESALSPIASEAKKQGFNIEWSTDLSDKADIGIYNDHVTNIKSVNSDLSCILFHGIDDELKSGWLEGWNRFDIGFVTGDVAASEWQDDSINPRAKPEIGVFPVGWPKADIIQTKEFQKEVNNFVEINDIADKSSTVLYAPSGPRSDEKQMREFLDATENIFKTRLIKQHSAVETPVPKQLQSRVESNDDILVLDPKQNIMKSLAMSGILLTEESSVLLEAPLTNTIPVSVVDWPFKNNWDSASESNKKLPASTIRLTRDGLSEDLRHIKSNYEEYMERNAEFKNSYFNNVGCASEYTVRVIKSIVNSENPPIQQITPKQSSLFTKAYFALSVGIADRLGEDTVNLLKNIGVGKVKHRLDMSVTNKNR